MTTLNGAYPHLEIPATVTTQAGDEVWVVTRRHHPDAGQRALVGTPDEREWVARVLRYGVLTPHGHSQALVRLMREADEDDEHLPRLGVS